MVRGSRELAFALLLPLLAACEAKLRLDGVEATRAQSVRRTDQFQSVVAAGERIVVVANHGVVVVSDDAGGNWRRHELAGWPSLIDIARCPDGQLVALAYEREIWVAPADASQWTRRAIASEETPQALTCDPQGRLWVVGSFSSFAMSPDMGKTWQTQSLDEDLFLTTVQFLDQEHAIATGEFGTVVTTRDGGQTWALQPPMPEEFYPSDTWFQSAQVGWAVGLQGRVYGTMDGGQTWQLESTPTLAPLFRLGAIAGVPHAVGGDGIVLRRRDGHWELLPYAQPFRTYLRALAAVGERVLVAGGGGALRVLEPTPPASPVAMREPVHATRELPR